ncbi:unnamed protein product [Parnassius apollo]|uniref:(apollo) hypothetical protein n=1 Tax=Parnassius apollo TaxID=110799 RepID=A0A8S3XHX4_PARAO|nr:unnamed protein product [Parnassius apollo]
MCWWCKSSMKSLNPREKKKCMCAVRAECLWADAEALACAARCAGAVFGAGGGAAAGGARLRLRLGHGALVRALLRCVGLEGGAAGGAGGAVALAALREYALGRLARVQLQTHLATLPLDARRAAMLLRLAEADVPLHDLPHLVAKVTHAILSYAQYSTKTIHTHVQQDRWSGVLQRALRELAEVERRARALGVDVSAAVPPVARAFIAFLL